MLSQNKLQEEDSKFIIIIIYIYIYLYIVFVSFEKGF